MKTTLFRTLGLVCALPCFACGDAEAVRVEHEDPGKNCEFGGQRIELDRDGETARSYVCSAESGEAHVELLEEPAGDKCETGGYALSTTVGDAPAVTSYLCNGLSPHVVATAEPAGKNCETGGIRLLTSDDRVSFVCHGKPSGDVEITDAGSECGNGGARIRVGDVTLASLCDGFDVVNVRVVEPGTVCPAGGSSFRIDDEEPRVVCNGINGRDGDDAIVVALSPGNSDCPSGGMAVRRGSGTPTAICLGGNGTSVTLSSESAGANCNFGGVRLRAANGSSSYICHDGFAWKSVTGTAPTKANEGYLAESATPISLTLPSLANVHVGDVVRFVNRGSGAVSVTPNANQNFRFAPGALKLPSTMREVALGLQPIASASSSNGTIQTFTTRSDRIYVSSDSGSTWTPRSTSGTRASVASSADGTRLAVIGHWFGGDFQKSTDSGATWTTTLSSNWSDITMSDDGMLVLASPYSGQLLLSTNGGDNWTAQGPDLVWSGVASSSTGQWLIASSYDGLFTSNDSGLTWERRLALMDNWRATASSSSGAVLYAANGDDGHLYVSHDYGITWEARAPDFGSTNTITCSGDGESVAVPNFGGSIRLSSDRGQTWTDYGPNAGWAHISLSPDGSKMVGLTNDSIYISGTGSVVLLPESSVSLTYVGSNTFFLTEVHGNVEAP